MSREQGAGSRPFQNAFRASVLPGGLKPGLGPLRGRVLKDMTWK